MRILISAYACLPNRGSEPGIGWLWSLAAASTNEVTILTRSRHEQKVREALAAGNISNVTLLCHDWLTQLEPWTQHGLLARLHYVLWQFSVLLPAWQYSRREHIDVVHHITFNGIDFPGLLWLLPSRFVWGPVGGGQRAPATMKLYFADQWSRESRRNWRKKFMHLNPIVILASKRATPAIAANNETLAILRRSNPETIKRIELTLGPDYDPPPTLPPAARRPCLRIGWAGRLEWRKALHLALDAVQYLRDAGVDFELLIAGDGPLRAILEQESHQRNLQSCVHFLGLLPHDRLSDFYRTLDVFLFTSLQDTSGNVVLEAMAQGVPIVGLAHQGVPEIVTPECGDLVEVTDPTETSLRLGLALSTMARNPELRLQMGQAALLRAQSQYSFASLITFLEELYSASYPVAR